MGKENKLTVEIIKVHASDIGLPRDRFTFENAISKAIHGPLTSYGKCVFWNAAGTDPVRFMVDQNLSETEFFREHGKRMKELEDSGIELVNNFELMSKVYINFLAKSGTIAMPYTEYPILEIGETVSEKTKKVIETIKQRTENRLPLLVKKPNGLRGTDSHGGRGVEVLDPTKNNFKWNDDDLIFQEFIYPPLNIFKDGYIRDARIILIGGEPKVWYIRKAQERLINPATNELEEYPPSKSRFLTNICQNGKIEDPPKELKKRSFQFAKEVHSSILDWGNFFRKNIWEINGEAKCGFCAVDLMYKPDGNPVLLEVDFYPNLNSFPKLEVVAEKLSKYFKEISSKTGKKILINNLFKDYIVANETIRCLDKKNIKCGQIGLGK